MILILKNQHTALLMKKTCLNILIVDDATLVVQRLFEILNEISCVQNLSKAISYNEAVEFLNNQLPDIILLDIQLPGKNGIELLTYIREKYPSIITVMLTNRVSIYYKELCENIGAHHFVDKSSEFESIQGIIESYILPKPKRQQEKSAY